MNEDLFDVLDSFDIYNENLELTKQEVEDYYDDLSEGLDFNTSYDF